VKLILLQVTFDVSKLKDEILSCVVSTPGSEDVPSLSGAGSVRELAEEDMSHTRALNNTDLRIGVEAPLLNSAAKQEAVSAPQKVTQFLGKPNSAHLFANGARLEGAA
jgi:hypothetical protein